VANLDASDHQQSTAKLNIATEESLDTSLDRSHCSRRGSMMGGSTLSIPKSNKKRNPELSPDSRKMAGRLSKLLTRSQLGNSELLQA
jgi:hypothetical protein